MKNNKVVMILEKDFQVPILDQRVYKEAISLTKFGYDVTIITWSMRMDPYKYPKIYNISNITIIRIFQNVAPVIRNNIYKLYPLISLFVKTYKVIKKINPDFIHCHDALPLLVSYALKKKLRCKLIYDSHELNPFRGESWVFLKFFAFSEKIAWKNIDAVITANNVRKQFMEEHNKPKNYIVLNNYPISLNSSIYQQKILPSKVVFIYQGGVSINRGIDNICKAFTFFREYDFKFEIYGVYHPNKSKYVKLIKEQKLSDKIFLYDAVDSKILDSKMSDASVGIVSLLNTSLNNYYCAPNKLYDYMKHGLFVMGPDFPHIKEEIESVGISCDFENIYSIKKSIKKIFSKLECLPSIQNKAQKLHLSQYNWQKEEIKLYGLYKNLKNYIF